MRIELGYPPAEAEQALLGGVERRQLLSTLPPVMEPAQLNMLQTEVDDITCSPALLTYILKIVQHTRLNPRYREGLSPRAGLALRNAAKAWALLEGRQMVVPEDVQAVLPSVVCHRLQANDEVSNGNTDVAQELSLIHI